MSGKTVVDQIKHYQKDIERCPENSERMIRCIQRLYVLPIQVLHLQETGVGRSVNSLRKYKGEVGEAAKALVAKWKAMVAAEESSDDSNDKHRSQSTDNRINKSNISSVKTESKPEKPSIKVEPKSEKSIVKSEQKTEKQCLSNKDKSSSKDRSNSKDKSSYNDKVSSKEKPIAKHHHSTSKHYSESSSHSSSKSHSSSLKRSHSGPGPEKNHTSLSDRKKSSHSNHKSSYHDKEDMSDDEGSPPTNKRLKNHHSHSRNNSHPKKEVVESDEEADESNDEGNDTGRSEADDSSSNSENSSAESDNSSGEEEDVERRGEQREEEDDEDQDSDISSGDQRHHSKHKSTSQHKHKKSSHLHSDKNKENYNNHKNSSRHSSKNSSSRESKSISNNLDELIKENEKKVKKEKDSEFEVPKYIPTKIVKLERNEDGSIDSGSGASFADALLGMDNLAGQKKKNKKPVSSKETSSSNNKSSSSHKSSSSSSTKRSHGHSSGSSTSAKEKSREGSIRMRPIDELVETPDLLTKKVKLEALDLDISSTLPEINPNYKPLPHVPESFRRSTKSMSEEDAMFSIMTTKNQRTKVYSGNKVYQDVVPSLFSLCIQLLYENIDAVEYTGGVPYSLLKPLLEKLNSDQLYVIEHFNPYLIEETDNLWKFHCSKDFRSERRQDMESWRDLYLRCLEERERKLKALTANISQSMAKSTPVRQAKLAYVDAVVKPPRNVARKQAKYGTGTGSSSSSNNNKQDILSKAIVGGHTPGVSAKDVVPAPPTPRASSHHATPAIMKKKKAPLMQKALQFIKGNRYKR